MWLAHALTLSRLALAGLFWTVVDHPWWAREMILIPMAALYRFTPWLRAPMRQKM